MIEPDNSVAISLSCAAWQTSFFEASISSILFIIIYVNNTDNNDAFLFLLLCRSIIDTQLENELSLKRISNLSYMRRCGTRNVVPPMRVFIHPHKVGGNNLKRALEAFSHRNHLRHWSTCHANFDSFREPDAVILR